MNLKKITHKESVWALAISTIAFTACFAVWTIFSIIGIKIKQDLGLNDAQFGLLVATPILTGSISRIFLGIWTDQYGGRRVFTVVMLLAALGAYLLTMASSFYTILAFSLLLGLAGGGFAVGIAYVSSWFEAEKQGTALGIFGMGNVGAAVTTFGAPFLLMSHGWHFVAQVYAVIFVIVAILFFILTKEDPKQQARKQSKQKPESILTQLEPLKHLQVWRFSLYYFFVFGAFVALALWLPIYYVNVYGLSITSAGMLTALYCFIL